MIQVAKIYKFYQTFKARIVTFLPLNY